MTECEKMKKGFWYDANNDAELLELRENAEELCYSFNQTSPKMTEKKEKIMMPFCQTEGKIQLYFRLFTQITATTALSEIILLLTIMRILWTALRLKSVLTVLSVRTAECIQLFIL